MANSTETWKRESFRWLFNLFCWKGSLFGTAIREAGISGPIKAVKLQKPKKPSKALNELIFLRNQLQASKRNEITNQ